MPNVTVELSKWAYWGIIHPHGEVPLLIRTVTIIYIMIKSVIVRL